MSSPGDRDWQRELEKLEAEVNRDTTSQVPNESTEISVSDTYKNWLNSAKNWFDRLPQVGKIAVAVGAVWLSFSLLNTFLHIVSSLISIAFIGLLLYVGYKFVSNSASE
ncbi:hypothetical protein [Myxosarcina sp. GI1]|uniref:hypothetical protein n=1 Tax=Myxosarcina sp. GI1 TaxID=1541065 RepID=UPI00056B1DCC|nr:hypothetical protein [Myxosarcina sp. GI1]